MPPSVGVHGNTPAEEDSQRMKRIGSGFKEDSQWMKRIKQIEQQTIGTESEVTADEPFGILHSTFSIPEVWDWLRTHCKTMDAVGGIKPFPDYPFVKRLVEALDRKRILLVAKSRQMLATWTLCGWMLHRALYVEPGLFLLLSKGARDTSELVKRLRVMARHLPAAERLSLRIKATEIESETGSRILALPATEDAARMYSPTAVFWDEMAFTPYSEEIWTAVKPAIDSGGRFCGVSTPNGTDNVFYRLYNDPGNGFGKLKIHWRDHPGRDEAWEREARRGLSNDRWRQEYEVDFEVLADRIYDEFTPEEHLLPQPYRWQPDAGRVYRGIDFGYRHPYAVWAQLLADGTLVVFDEWEGRDATVEDLAEALARIDARHGLTENDVTLSGCDPAGASHTDAGLSPAARLQQMGYKLAWRTSQILTGVELIKLRLRDARGRVRLKFSSDAKQTVYHLKHYRWEVDGKQPDKDDIHDHAMDALRYLVINLGSTAGANWTGARVEGGRRV